MDMIPRKFAFFLDGEICVRLSNISIDGTRKELVSFEGRLDFTNDLGIPER